MSKNNKEIDFLTNKTFIGEFSFPNKEKYFGKLIYEKDKLFHFIVYSDSLLGKNEDDILFKNVYAKLSDEMEQTYFVSFKKCRLYLSCFGTSGIRYEGLFDYAIFSTQRCFDFEKEKIDNTNLFINVWDEFCFPQGVKSRAEYQPKMLEFKLKNKLPISFNQDIRYHYLSENKIFDSLFCSNKLTLEEKNTIENQLKEILLPYKNKIGIKLADRHNWYISIKNISSKYTITEINWLFESLLTYLTKDFGTTINKITFNSKKEKDEYSTEFYFLNYRHFPKQKTSYSFRYSPFKFNSFSKEEWGIILNNLFKNKNQLQKYFYILGENNEHNNISEFHILRYIDCIAAIGISKKYKSEKYEKVLKDFACNLGNEDKQKLLSTFRNNLNYIKISDKQNKKKKRNWGLMGIKLSELRALTTHFQDKNQTPDVFKCFEVYEILELIIIDYIFETLEVPEQKRLEYKKYYLNKILNLRK